MQSRTILRTFLGADVVGQRLCERIACASLLTMTRFAHDFTEPETLLRLFDLFLASHPLMPLYFGVAVRSSSYHCTQARAYNAQLIVHRREELLKEERDFSMLHSRLSKVPRDLQGDLVETLVQKAQSYCARHPPHSLLDKQTEVSSDAMFLQYPFEWMASDEHFRASGRLEREPNERHELFGMSANTLLVAGLVVAGAVAVYALQSDGKM